MTILIKAINRGLCALLLFLSICFAIIVIQTLCTDGWRLQVSISGIKGMFLFWAEYTPLIKMFGCALTLCIASFNLSKYLDIETANALSELRRMMNSREKKRIHYYLLEAEDKEVILPEIDKEDSDFCCELSNVELFDYLGIIELGAIMLKRGIILPEEFSAQFGYRAKNLWRNPEVKRHIQRNQQYYENILYIVRKFNL